MLNRSANLAMSTSVLEALPGEFDIKRHSPSILNIFGFKLTPFKQIHSIALYMLARLIPLQTDWTQTRAGRTSDPNRLIQINRQYNEPAHEMFVLNTPWNRF